MSASPISLEASIRTCKVISGWANRIQSDRFQNPNLMECPVWNNLDSAGREVNQYSFYTKSAGCNLPMDRVAIENTLRPKYFEYVNLDASGLNGNNMSSYDAATRTKDYMEHFSGQSPNFGLQLSANSKTVCPNYSYTKAIAQESQNNRMTQSLNEGFRANQIRAASGF